MSTTLVLLPGLDGSGELFEPFVRLAQDTFECRVLRYDHAPDQSYERLADALAPQLPTDRSFVLLGESFGGPLALRLAAQRPARIDSVVLVSSFARSPLSVAQELALPLLSRVPLARLPASSLRNALLGDDAPDALVERVRVALRGVPASVLRARLRTLASCDETQSYLHCMAPMFYLQASRDRLLPARARELLAYLRPGLVIGEVDAPHLLLQRAPREALAQLQVWLLDDKRQA